VKSDKEIISEEIPERAFFSPKELGDLGPFSRDYWQKRISDGSVRAVQRNARRQGSRTLIPRNEVVRHLAEQVR